MTYLKNAPLRKPFYTTHKPTLGSVIKLFWKLLSKKQRGVKKPLKIVHKSADLSGFPKLFLV
jgi:hypothetical protein